MKKLRVDTYNDGVCYLLENKAFYDESGNAVRKELIQKSFFYFGNSRIREEDRVNLAEGNKETLKIKIRRNNIINSNCLIRLNEKVYNIKALDKNNRNLYLYLEDWIDEMDKIVEFYTVEVSNSALQDDREILYKKVFANVSVVDKVKKEIIIKTNYSTTFNTDLKIKFGGHTYKIISIEDIDLKHEICVINGVEI